MIICACFFTQKGKSLLDKLKAALPEITWFVRNSDESLKTWAESAFKKRLPLLFIGAAGIAVRTIADFAGNKLNDSPVLVLDELGRFVVPLLSGHIGGANDIADLIAGCICAQSVITTATDVEAEFAVDVFAKDNGLRIMNKDGIKQISAAVLEGKTVMLWANPAIQLSKDDVPPCIKILTEKARPEFADILIELEENCGQLQTANQAKHCKLLLVPRLYCAGMGCKKGKTFEELDQFLASNFAELDSLYALASIDLKKDELGLMTLAQYHHVPFFTFSAEELKLAEGSFSESEFVEKTTGVSNVCERAAILCAGKGAELIMKKTAGNGMTLAVAKRAPVISKWRHR
ncbi:MAG: cobalamin biosynthesis protein [Spirochaetaceae bacterium]|nr:cobalamin biosynthesis protein [Spirochaetaceae bacterium]